MNNPKHVQSLFRLANGYLQGFRLGNTERRQRIVESLFSKLAIHALASLQHLYCIIVSAALAAIHSAAMLRINAIDNATPTVSLHFKKAPPKLELAGIARRKRLSRDNFDLWRPQTTLF